MDRSIEREALGRIASLGHLYDARCDQFNECNIFKTKIPDDAISSIDNQSMNIDYAMSDSLEEKFRKMDIGGEIRVSILGGLVEGKGSASYLSDEKKSAKSIRCSMYYKSKTKTESLNIYFDKLADAVSTKALQDEEATHVVVGISWGANATITFDYDNKEKLDRQEIEGAFQAHAKMIAATVKAKAEIVSDESITSKNINFKIHIFADITAPDEPIPSTPSEALAFLRKLPTHAKEANDGKGKPLTYKLVPISMVQKRFSVATMVDRVVVGLNEHALIDFIRLFDELSQAKQRLYDLCFDITSHKFCIREEDIRKAEDARVGMEKGEATLRSNFAETLVAFRSGEKTGSAQLDELRCEHIKSQYSAKEINLLVDSFSEVTEKISFADFLVKNGVTYIGRGTSFDEELRKNMFGTVYILFFRSKEMKSKVWRRYQKCFTKLIKPEKSDAKKEARSELETFLAVDLDLREDIADQEGVGEGIRICKYENEDYTSYDLVADEDNKPIPIPNPEKSSDSDINRKDHPLCPRFPESSDSDINRKDHPLCPRSPESSDSDINRKNHPLCPRFRVKHVLPFNPQAVAIWNDKLYIPYPRSPDIRVYNADPFVYQRTITVKGMKSPYDIVVSENVLYVSEYEDTLIHKIQLPEESVSTWTKGGIRLKLSIAKNENVIVASWLPDKILEYTTFGNLVRKIVVDRFDANLVGLQHAIQMEGDKFLVCHAMETHNRVFMIDNTGRVIKCYGGNKGSGIGHLNGPVHLAVDRNGFILVADLQNNRIVHLNSSLEFISETVGIQKPSHILLNEERGRLYAIEFNDESLTVFDV